MSHPTTIAAAAAQPEAAERTTFGRHCRLLSSAQYRTVLAQRQIYHGRYIRLHACRNPLSHPRLGLIVSKKVSKRAVERNRIKRQVRASFRLHRCRLSAVDFIVAAKPGAERATNAVLRVEIDRLWSRAQRLCDN